MTLLMDVVGPAAPPRSNGELVFAEPWENRAFAMAVPSCEAGVFSWREFQEALITRIARHTTPRPWCYYGTGWARWRMCWPAGAPYGITTSLLGPRNCRSGPPARSRTAMTTSVRPILVTGATGRIGGIGRHVAAELVKRGLPVKALIRRLDERSEALQAMGIHW